MRKGSGGGKPRTGYPQAMALLVTHTQTFWFYETKTWSSLKVIVRDHEHRSTWVSKPGIVWTSSQWRKNRVKPHPEMASVFPRLQTQPPQAADQSTLLHYSSTVHMHHDGTPSPCLSYNSRRKRYLCSTSKSLRSLETLNTQRVSFQANWHVKSFLVPSEFMTFPLDALKLYHQSSDIDI